MVSDSAKRALLRNSILQGNADRTGTVGAPDAPALETQHKRIWWLLLRLIGHLRNTIAERRRNMSIELSIYYHLLLGTTRRWGHQDLELAMITDWLQDSTRRPEPIVWEHHAIGPMYLS
jgi:hypothetical protein